MASSSYSIQIVNRSGAYKGLLPLLKKNTLKILKEMKWDKASVSITLVNDGEIAKINQTHLKHKGPTDVITFGSLDPGFPATMIDGLPFLGDIIISVTTAKRQAKEYGTTFMYELCFYICHGLLHIAGFDDARKKDRERMLKIQTEILESARIYNRAV